MDAKTAVLRNLWRARTDFMKSPTFAKRRSGMELVARSMIFVQHLGGLPLKHSFAR